MTLYAWNSFQYGSTGWSGSGSRTAGAGQSGYASMRLTTAQQFIFGHAAQDSLIHSFCYRPNGTSTASEGQFASMGDASGNVLDLTLVGGPAGEIICNRSNNTVELARSLPGIINPNVETFIEWRVDNALGEVEVRANGNPTPVVNYSGGGIAAGYVEFRWYGAGGSRDFSAWTMVIVDATAPNDFLGHYRYGCLDADGNGASSDFVGSDSDSTDNYLLIDDGFTPDDDSTYVQSPTVGDVDTYAMADLPTPALSIIAVCPLMRAKKTDAGSRALTAVIRSGGTDYDGAIEQFLSTSYSAYREAFLEDPDTSAPWDEAGVNAMEVGMKVTT